QATLEEKAQRLKDRARIHRYNKLMLTARKDTGRLLQGAQAHWDARGRSIYGDAWDANEDGNLPLSRNLFNLPREEIDSVREEASRLLGADRSRSEFSSPLPTPPTRDHHATDRSRVSQAWSAGAGREERRVRTASARRGPASSRPFPGAPYVDTRFVHAPSPVVVPQLDFTRLNNNAADFPVAPYHKGEPRPRKAAAAAGRIRRRMRRENWSPNSKRVTAQAAAPSGPTDITAGGQQLLPEHRRTIIAASLQEPGLTHPKPPDVPVTRAATAPKGAGSERESLSARLARLATIGDTARVVPLDLV
ncbi:unnamed protein product, partial [Laminaria digitata]